MLTTSHRKRSIDPLSNLQATQIQVVASWRTCFRYWVNLGYWFLCFWSLWRHWAGTDDGGPDDGGPDGTVGAEITD